MSDSPLEPQEAELRRRLAYHVKALREEMKLSVKEAAKRADLDPRHWQKIEDQRANAKVKTVTKLARALDIDPSELLREIPGVP